MREKIDWWGEKRVPGWDRASSRAIEQGRSTRQGYRTGLEGVQQGYLTRLEGTRQGLANRAEAAWQGLAGGVVFAEAVDGGFDKAGGADAGGGEKGRQDIPAGKGETANDANGVGRHVVTQ